MSKKREADTPAETPDPNDKPTSREEFAKAQEEGTTVGHEWARRSEEEKRAARGEIGETGDEGEVGER